MLLTVHMFTSKMPLYSLLLTLFIPICAYASPQTLEDAKDLFYKGSYPAAKPLLEEAKACCEGEALYYLARIAEHNPSPNSTQTTIQLYHESAALGYSPSMVVLANKYAIGDGVEQNLLTATDWLRKAGDTERKPSIQIINVETDQTVDVIDQWKRKAEQSDSNAIYRLARIYDDGILVPRNLTLAAKYYQEAANLGHVESEFMTGYFLCRGIGISQDINQANQWLTAYRNGLSCQ